MTEEQQNRVRFANPPLVETVLGVQFAPLANFTSGHFGWYWKQYLGDDWTTAIDAPLLPDQFERFGDQRSWLPPGLHVVGIASHHPDRLQITSANQDRMVQVQHTRFIYNWRRQTGEYPMYDVVRSEFDELFAGFCKFVADSGSGQVSPNQWEATYVNQIPKGSLWESPSDWHRILPGILAPQPGLTGTPFESLGGEWHYELTPQKGRLHVAVQHGRAASAAGPEVLTVQLTARGPIPDAGAGGVGAGLDLGHDMIVRAFLEMTGSDAHRLWGRADQ